MLFKKVRNRRDISYIFVKNPKLDRFYLVPKIHKRLYNLPGGPVILNLGYFTGNIYFLLISTKMSAQKVKSYIQDTNDFLKNIANLPLLPDGLILCTIDGVGLYPNTIV